MTDRDTFAAAALTGLLADDGDRIDHAMTDFTRRAYEWADAMMRNGAAGGCETVHLTNDEREAVLCSQGYWALRRNPHADTLHELLERTA